MIRVSGSLRTARRLTGLVIAGGALVLALVIAGCSADSGGGDGTERVTIYVSAPLSGSAGFDGMDIKDGAAAPHLHDREQVRALILLAAHKAIGGASISNLPDPRGLINELADEAERRGVVLAVGSAHEIVARRA